MKALDYSAVILVIIGAINWGLIGFLNFDLVSTLFGNATVFSRVVFAIVGICGLYSLSFLGRLSHE
ncbi:DUF378 domain-containing protein [Anaeromicropila populeti]|uniref:DUF378 domain-containing protein n=1 Tax=Anaeromicropila populeti TaxID=37658 RepID=A0A1I6L838_9FIRM|nr:DUF378 domain-containing protein [Anaeromicropila populeti]SFR99663.1 hypothetical protein SAMN05661086_03139 [Anaeromicropila populeti]